MKFYRNIIDNAHQYLNHKGYLCLEIGYNQKSEVKGLIDKSKKYKDIYVKKDLGEKDRIIIAKYT